MDGAQCMLEILDTAGTVSVTGTVGALNILSIITPITCSVTIMCSVCTYICMLHAVVRTYVHQLLVNHLSSL